MTTAIFAIVVWFAVLAILTIVVVSAQLAICALVAWLHARWYTRAERRIRSLRPLLGSRKPR